MNEKPTDTVTDDVIWGVGGPNGIAAFLNIKPARAYYLISIKAIPVNKVSHRIITASRRELAEWVRGNPHI